MRHGEWVGQNPQGAVMDDGVSVWHRDVPYGNSRPARGPGARSAEGVPPGVCFFDSFSAQAKQRSLTAEWLVKNAPAASGTLHEKEDPSRKAIELEGSPWT